MSWNQELAVGGRWADQPAFRHLREECVLEFTRSILAVIRGFFCTRGDTALEVFARRQQVAVLQRKRRRPSLNSLGPSLLDNALQLVALLYRRPRHRRVRRPSSPGIAPGFVATGIGVPGRGAVGPRSPRKFVIRIRFGGPMEMVSRCPQHASGGFLDPETSEPGKHSNER